MNHTKLFGAAQMKGFWYNAIATIRRSLVKGQIITYGANDRLPNQIVDDVNDSGTASACVGKIQAFVQGEGFEETIISINERGQGLVSKEMSRVMVNPDQTTDALLAELAMNVSYMESLVLRITFTREGEIGNVYAEPVTSIRRLSDMETFRYNKYYGYKFGYLKSNDRDLPDFMDYVGNSPEVIKKRRELVEYQLKTYDKVWGCILYKYYPKLGEGYNEYSVPAYFSGIDDIRADANLSRVELGNILNGFKPQVVIATGYIDKVNKDENDKSAYDYFSENLKNFVGPDGDTILHLEGNDPTQMPQVTVINPAEMMDGIDKSRDRVPRAVCRHFEVPPVLIGLETAGKLGATQELLNQMKLFKMNVDRKQRLIIEAFQLIWPNVEWSIKEFTLFTAENEVEQIEQIEAQASKTNQTLTNLTGRQLQNVQRIVRKFNKGELTYDQAAVMLKQGFGFTDEQVDIWLITNEEE